MDTRHLQTFQIVAQQGSFSAAARELGLTANAVAQRLRALEGEFGMPLVARSGRTVRPTEAGHAVLERLPAILGEIRRLRAAAQGENIAGELRVGAIATALTGILPPVLDELARQHPRLRLHLEPGTSAELYERTRSGDLDASAIVAPAFDLPKSINFTLWCREPLVLLTPESVTQDDPLAILGREPVILYDRNQWGGRLAAAWLESTQLPIQPRFELDALDAIALMVNRGLGVAVVPDWPGPRPEGIRLRKVPLPAPAPERRIGLLFSRHGPQTRLVEVLDEATQRIGGHLPRIVF